MTDAGPDPTTIGPFVVLRKLGEGAMGVVFMGWDNQLERRVALKLVRRQLLNKARVRDRMIREAQAMARLSNPHVVQVYQVGEHDDGIYVAMEYVEGQTLGAWLRAERRPWQEVLRTICDAGRGLAAAHAAGLVHRDFKPDNVLVDAAGHARVLDFGLVQAEAGGANGEERVEAMDEAATATTQQGEEAIDRSHLHWSVRLTQIGNVMGTPAYMSPEQHFGKAAGPAADQFSFAVTLYEALYGTRPFGGDTWEAIRTQIRMGIVPPPSLESTVPRRLFKVLARALAQEPEGRWPGMDAMIEALEHDPWRVRLRATGMAGLIAAASVGSYAVAAAQVEGTRCEADPQQLAGVWDAGREAAVSRAFAGTKAAFAGEAWSRVKKRLDGYAQALTQARQEACEAHASGSQTSRLMDLRIACIGRRRAHLGALVEVLTTADAAVVENAVQAAAALPSVASCSDEEALLTAASAPDDPEVAGQVEASRAALARVFSLGNTGKYDEALTAMAEARAAVETLGYAPLTAEAALVEGRVLMNLGRPADAEAVLTKAVRVGIAQDLHALAAEAAAIRIYVVGAGRGAQSEALATEPFAAALVERARDDGVLLALLLNNVGIVHHTHGEREEARGYYERALEALVRVGQEDPLIAALQNNLANLYLDQGRLDESQAWFTRAVEGFTRMLGDNHPYVAHAIDGVGDVRLRKGEPLAAIPEYLRALAIMEGSYGLEHRYLLDVLSGLGRANIAAGRKDEAGRVLARALAIADKQGIRSEHVGVTLEGLAELAAGAGAKEQARGLYGRAAEVFDEAVGADSEEGARTALRAGELAQELGEREAALRWFERVLAKKPGSSGQVKSRPAAALRLAALLPAGERACALAREAAAGEGLRAEAEALIASRCPA